MIKKKANPLNDVQVTPNADSATVSQRIGDGIDSFFEISDPECASRAQCSIKVAGCSDTTAYTGNLELKNEANKWPLYVKAGLDGQAW